MHALAGVLETRGVLPYWKNSISGNKWGININDFSYRQRDRASEIVFVRGNAGYKDRKAGDLILPELAAIAKETKYKVKVYSQAEVDNSLKSKDLTITENIFPERKSVYETGDIFIFCSYWEGLCHGIYEASYSGGLVLTTDTGPMNECIPAFLVDVEEVKSEKLGKLIKKAVPSMTSMRNILNLLEGKDISKLSRGVHNWTLEKRNLSQTLSEMYSHFCQYC